PISNEAYYNERVKPELNDESIIYLGHLDHNSLNALIGKCRATLFLSTWEEPYGLAIAESLACGTPVVAYNKGAAPEILTPSCGVLVEEHDIKALVAATTYAMGLSRKDCRERAEKFCSIEDMVSAYEQLYAELISQGKEKQLLSS
ncbi:MAG: glycosyltransferase, partial [Leeuwenhoekiella sp.]